MFEGRIAEEAVFALDLSVDYSANRPTPLHTTGGGGSMRGAYTPDYLTVAEGVYLYGNSVGGHDPGSEFVLRIPALGIDETRTLAYEVGAFDTSVEVFCSLTTEATATWRLDVSRVLWTYPGGTYDVSPCAALRSTMVLTPMSAPVFGQPPTVYAHASTNVVPSYPTYPHGSPPPAGDLLELSSTATGTFAFSVGGLSSVGTGSAYSTQEADNRHSVSETRSEMALPDAAPKVVRMEPGYLAVVFRGGLCRGRTLRGTTTFTQDSFSLDGPDPVTVTVRTDTLPLDAQFLAVVGDAAHVVEDPLSAAFPKPYQYSKSYYAANDSTIDGGAVAETFPAEIDQSTALSYLTHADPFAAFVNTRLNPHWSYLLWQPPDGASDAVGWKAFGGVQDPPDCWLPIRQQVSRHPSLPEGEATQERIDVFAEALGANGLAGLMRDRVFGQVTSFWGIADLTPLPLAPESFSWDVDAASLWSGADGAAVAVSSSGIVATGAGTARLDLGDWTVKPAMLPRLARRLTVGWDALPSGATVKVYLEGLDGERILITDTVAGTFDIPRAAAKKKTGSWKEDFAPAPLSDVGISTPTTDDASFRMASGAEEALSTLSPKAQAWARLAFDVDPGSGTSVALHHPQGTVDASEWGLARESGQWASLPLKDGPVARFSGLFWDALTDALLDEPETPGFGCPTAWDGLAWRSSVARGAHALADPHALALESGWYEGSEWIDPKHLARDPFTQAQVTTAFVARDASDRPLPCVVNTYRGGTPPLRCFPRPVRDKAHGWGSAGSLGMEGYSLCSPVRRVLGVSGSSPSMAPTTGRAWISDGALVLPAGWEGRAYRVATDGDEGADWPLKVGSVQLATARPWRGYLILDGIPVGGRPFGLDVSRSGRWARAYGLGGTLRIGFAADYALPGGWADRDTGIAADWARVRYPRVGAGDPLFVLVGRSDALALYRLGAEAGTLAMSHSIGSGSAGELLALVDGPLLAWRVDGGAVYLRRFRRDEAEIGTERATNLTGLDDGAGVAAGVAAGFYTDSRNGRRRIGLLHSVGGALVLRLSDDGETFDA